MNMITNELKLEEIGGTMDKEGENLWKNASIANGIHSLLENKKEYVKYIKLNAELRYKKYSFLIEAGFSKEQALHIVTNTKTLE